MLRSFLRPIIGGLLFILSSGLAVVAQTITVTGTAEFQMALTTAPMGSTILLNPGDYGQLRLTGDIDATTIGSADPHNPARFSSADVRNVADLSFENLLFDYRYNPEHRITVRPFMWRDSRNLTLRGNIFDGDVANNRSALEDGFGFGFGLAVWGSREVLLEGNEISNFFKGLHIRDAHDVVVRQNDISAIRSDGMNFVQVADVLIEENHIHDFRRSLESGDHSDMIQFWTARTEWPSRNVIIRGNVLNAGDGWFTQSIFLRNERSDRLGSTDLNLFYNNFIIEDNVILNAHLHGISVGDTIGLVIRGNTVVQNPTAATGDPGDPRHVPTIRVAETNRSVRIEGNITGAIVGYAGQPDWEVASNLAVQNVSRLQPNFYGTVFAGTDWRLVESFRHRPGGPADRAGLGADMLRRAP